MEYCHSTARAEKDLIVDKALEAYDEYQDPEAGFALDGGTSLSKYRGLIARFSEDLDIRVLLPKDVLADAVAKRDAMHRVGERFREYMVDAMPFLTPTSKGRLQRDGTVHSLIFDYSTPNTHPDVMQGLKCELVAMPLKREPNVVWRRGIDRRVVAVSEIVAGKFTALASRLPERGDSYPDLVRHAHDISVVKDIVAESPEFMASALDRLGTDRVNATLVELAKPAWSRHYGSYMSRMGTKPNPPPWQENLPFTYPSWPTVLEQTMRLCQSLGVATERTGKHVVERAAAMRKRPPSGDERD